MAGTDFFDDDLLQRRGSAERVKMGLGDQPAMEASKSLGAPDAPLSEVSDFNLTSMARRQKEMEGQSAKAVEELERLRLRQEALERERRQLEEVRQKQANFLGGREDLVQHLNKSLLSLEKEEIHAEQLATLLGGTRKRFKELLEDLRSIDEESWAQDQFREELNMSLDRIEEARMEYNKALARIQAVSGGGSAEVAAPAPVVYEREERNENTKGFSHWFLLGLAASLPLIVVLVLCMVFFYLINSGMI